MNLYEILKIIYKTNTAIGKAYPLKGKSRSGQAVGKWKRFGVPEDVAILCHYDPSIPYTHERLANESNIQHTDA
ncbi:hypothetical protein [Providencia sp. PROV_01]